MKSIFLIVSFFFSYSLFSQTTYTETIRFLEKNNDYSERHLCYGSTALVKVEYYKYNNNGYAVIYFKKSDSDIYGNPYIYCNISKDTWDRFINYGVYNSWGGAYDIYIKDNQCEYTSSNYNSSGYSYQNPKSSVNIPLTLYALEKAERRSNQVGSPIYYPNYNKFRLENFNLSYKFAFGVGVGLNSTKNNGTNINELFFTVRIGKNVTVDNVFSKYTNKSNHQYSETLFKQQFGVSSILNYNTSLFSKNLYLVTGLGMSYSKALDMLYNEFKKVVNPVLNFGIDYNNFKIPVLIGIYGRIDFGYYSSTGINLKYLIKN